MCKCGWMVINVVLKPSHHSPRRSPWVHAICIPHEWLHMPVSHHLHYSRIDLVQLPRINGKYLILNRSNVWVAILNRCTLSRLVRYVLSTTVYHRTDKVYHTSFGTQSFHCFLFCTFALCTPFMGSRNDSCGSVRLRVLIKRDLEHFSLFSADLDISRTMIADPKGKRGRGT